MKSQIRQYIVTHYLEGASDHLRDDTPLLELNIIDSVALLDLVEYFRTEFGLELPLREVHAANFASVDAMARMIARLSERPSPAEVTHDA